MPGPRPTESALIGLGPGAWALRLFKAPRSPWVQPGLRTAIQKSCRNGKESKSRGVEGGARRAGAECWCHLLNGESLGRIDVREKSRLLFWPNSVHITCKQRGQVGAGAGAGSEWSVEVAGF